MKLPVNGWCNICSFVCNLRFSMGILWRHYVHTFFKFPGSIKFVSKYLLSLFLWGYSNSSSCLAVVLTADLRNQISVFLRGWLYHIWVDSDIEAAAYPSLYISQRTLNAMGTISIPFQSGATGFAIGVTRKFTYKLRFKMFSDNFY